VRNTEYFFSEVCILLICRLSCFNASDYYFLFLSEIQSHYTIYLTNCIQAGANTKYFQLHSSVHCQNSLPWCVIIVYCSEMALIETRVIRLSPDGGVSLSSSIETMWWREFHWGRFLSQYFGFPLSISFHGCSIYIHLSCGGKRWAR
jgi:hypothetical protein